MNMFGRNTISPEKDPSRRSHRCGPRNRRAGRREKPRHRCHFARAADTAHVDGADHAGGPARRPHAHPALRPGGDIALKDAPATAPQPPRDMSPQGLMQKIMEAGATVEVCAIYLPGAGAAPEALTGLYRTALDGGKACAFAYPFRPARKATCRCYHTDQPVSRHDDQLAGRGL